MLAVLREWVGQMGMTQAELAARIGVSPASISAWFKTDDALRRGEPLPRPSRRFRYAAQSTSVQLAIADLLGERVDVLRRHSPGAVGRPAPGAPTTGSPSLELSAGLQGPVVGYIADLLGGRTPRPKSVVYRIAEVAASAEGVTTTVVVSEYRGSDRRRTYQYQVVVLAKPGCERDDVRAAVEQALRAERLPGHWEHGSLSPSVRIDREGDETPVTVGSLVVPEVEASREPSPTVSTLVPPGAGHTDQGHGPFPSVGVAVTPPYGGSRPMAGSIALALGLGHLRCEDVVNIADWHARIPREARRDTAEYVKRVLFEMQQGTVPGAWIVSMETDYPQESQSLKQMLIKFTGQFVAVRLGSSWLRMAAWRLAAAALNEGTHVVGGAAGSADPLLDVVRRSDSHLHSQALDLVQRHAMQAKAELVQLERANSLLGSIVEARTQAGLPTVAVELEELPDDGHCLRLEGDRLVPVTGDDRFDGTVLFADSVDQFVDAWVEASVEIVDRLARDAGHSGIAAIDLADGPVRRWVEEHPQ